MSLGPEHVEAVKAAADKIHAAAVLLSTAPTAPPAGGVHQIVMQSPDSGERAMHRVEKMAILLGGMLVAAIGLIWSQNSRMDDMKADISSERASREAYDNWSNQEHTTVRGYIWTGKIEPMRPKPTASEARK